MHSRLILFYTFLAIYYKYCLKYSDAPILNLHLLTALSLTLHYYLFMVALLILNEGCDSKTCYFGHLKSEKYRRRYLFIMAEYFSY